MLLYFTGEEHVHAVLLDQQGDSADLQNLDRIACLGVISLTARSCRQHITLSNGPGNLR
jgi:hypothetical protein